jgi:hypothetical protein
MSKRVYSVLAVLGVALGSLFALEFAKTDPYLRLLSMQMVGEFPESRLPRILPAFSDAPHKYGFIDKNGALKIAAKFDDAGDFHEGLAAVRLGNRWGYVNTRGTMVIKPQFHRAKDFSNGLAAVKHGKLWGYINKNGAFVIKPQFFVAENFRETSATVSDYVKYGLVGRKGEMLLPISATRLDDFSSGVARVQIDRTYGFLRADGTWLQEPIYADAGEFNEGLAAFQKDGLWGYLNETGAVAIAPKFKHAATFFDGVAAVKCDDGKYGLIDSRGNFVVKPTFNGLARMTKPSWAQPVPISANGLTPFVEYLKGWGFASNETGQPLIEPQFPEVNPFSEGFACVAIKDKVVSPYRIER